MYLNRARLHSVNVAAIVLLLSGVVAFVRHVTIRPKRPPYILRAATGGGDDLKGILSSSSYDSEVVKAYAGRTIKTAAKKADKVSSPAYDLSVDDSLISPTTAADTTTMTTTSGEAIKSALVETTTTTAPPPSAPSPPIVEQLESMTKSFKETISKSTSGSGSGGDSMNSNPLEGLSIPSSVQDAMEKPFSSLNNVLKSTQESIKEAQRAAAEQSSAASGSSTAAGGSSASGKVPTMADYMLKSLDDRRASFGVVTEKNAVDIKVPEVTLPDIMGDIKLPDMPSIQLPSVEKVMKYTPPTMPQPSVRMTHITLPEPGKALTLGEYVRAKAAGALPNDGGSTMSTMADIKAKFAIMVSNYFKLIGEEVPESLDDIQLPTMQDLSNLSDKLVNFDFQKFFDTLPDNAPWGAVALGTFLVVAGARKDAPVAPSTGTTTKGVVAPQTMEAATQALGGLTEDLEALQNRMKVLEATGMSLQAELKEAKEKLLEKELEISKERLKVADNKLTLNREVQKLERKLKDNDGQVQLLDKELAKTRDESEALRKELEAAKGAPKKSVSEPKVVEELPLATEEKPAPPPKKEVIAKKKTATKTTIAKKNAVEAVVEEAPPKTTARKKAASKKKGVSKAKEEPPSVFFAEEVQPVEPPPKKKVAAKKSAPTKAAKGEPDDWASLSKSTISRKTVKELSEYLETKGIAITGSDGKPLKKSDLVEAVFSL